MPPPSANMALTAVATKPFDGQKPGTSGLRKATKVFMETNYVENFVAATLEAMGGKAKGCTLVVGGDGRYFVKEVAMKIIQMCAAYGVSALTKTTNVFTNMILLDDESHWLLLDNTHFQGHRIS